MKYLLIILLLSVSLLACKKEKESENTADPQTVQQTDDTQNLKNESDDSNSDIQTALENFPELNGGRVAQTDSISHPICGCTIDASQRSSRIITLNFDGINPCGSPSRTRAGSIRFQLVQGNNWRSAGAVIEINYQNYKVTRLRDNKSITINGTKHLTNVRGTNWIGFLAFTDSLLYKERGINLTATFDGGAQSTFSIARLTQWKRYRVGISPHIEFKAMGDTVIDGQANTDTWGLSRFGYVFTNSYQNQLVSNTYCQVWRPVAGSINHRSNNNLVNITYGVNQEGNPTQTTCAYGWKLSWQISGGRNGSQIFSY